MIGDDSLPFGDGLAMTGTREALTAMTDDVSGPRRSTLLLGYAGWGEGQLEDELAENVWLTSLIERDPVRFWQGVSLLLVVLLAISLATR